jgi:hypothetical protein
MSKKTSPNFHQVKFNFKELKKFIKMELNLKVLINDLRENFSKLLEKNFFAKRLLFYFQDLKHNIRVEISSDQNLEDFFEIYFNKKKEIPPQILEIDVETEQEGA